MLASDLQGVAPSEQLGGRSVLLGEALCEHVELLADVDEIPPLHRIGAILAGDLYSDSSATERGATGDVSTVWQACSNTFRWVAGVQGNHDFFGHKNRDIIKLKKSRNIFLLDGRSELVDEMVIGGVGGIIGKKEKNARKTPDEFYEAVREVLHDDADIVVLHEGPDVPGNRSQRGSAYIRGALEHTKPRLIVCGHCHWSNPLAEIERVGQVLNVDARVVLLQRFQPST